MDTHAEQCYIKAGKIAAALKEYAREIILPGVPLLEIARKMDDKVEELGAELGFPVNLSTNEEAAHFTPDSTCTRKAEGLLKFDIGVVIDGYFADTAISFDLTKDKKHEEMVALNTKILENIEKTVKPGVCVCEIGDSVQDTLEEWNETYNKDYRIIKSLSGHELARNKIHAGLTISNYRNDNKTPLDEKAFAIEPFVTTGKGDIYEGKPGGIYVIRSTEKPRDNEARKLLDHIQTKYQTRPFCERWLERDGKTKIKYLLAVLEKQKLIYQYPLLIEKSKAPVSQMEHTFILSNGRVVVTTKE